MEIVGLGLHFEELPVGRKFRTIGRTVTESDLINYIAVILTYAPVRMIKCRKGQA